MNSGGTLTLTVSVFCAVCGSVLIARICSGNLAIVTRAALSSAAALASAAVCGVETTLGIAASLFALPATLAGAAVFAASAINDYGGVVIVYISTLNAKT